MKDNGESACLKGWNVLDSHSGPSTKMSKLLPWTEVDTENEKNEGIKISLNDLLIKNDFINNFADSFKKKKSMKADNAQLLNDPFQIAVIKHLLKDPELIPKLVEEIESIEWNKKQMDLYEFYQSTDLVNVKSPYISSFYNFITNDMKDWMEKLTGMKIQKVSMSCSMYNSTNFLLSHDDLLSDRLIAYVFYLSPWKEAIQWNESMGGALEVFKSDIDGQPQFPAYKKFFPSNNQLAFFKVEKKSHHQVGEVLTKDYPRLTIHGWFHGYKDNVYYDADAVKIKRPNVPIFQSPNSNSFENSKIINKNYLKDSIKAEIQQQIEENSEAGLGEFLTDEFLGFIQSDLANSSLKWTTKGPANQQNYEILDVQSVPKSSSLKKLISLVSSKQFFKLIHEYTELDVYGKNSKSPTCTVEFQRWKGGCYALINDPSTYSDDTLDLILNIGNNEGVGTITYLVPDKQDSDSMSDYENDEDDSVLLTIYPQNNFLNLVYRSAGTAKFTKYCYKSAIMDSEFNYILSCSYKE